MTNRLNSISFLRSRDFRFREKFPTRKKKKNLIYWRWVVTRRRAYTGAFYRRAALRQRKSRLKNTSRRKNLPLVTVVARLIWKCKVPPSKNKKNWEIDSSRERERENEYKEKMVINGIPNDIRPSFDDQEDGRDTLRKIRRQAVRDFRLVP